MTYVLFTIAKMQKVKRHLYWKYLIAKEMKNCSHKSDQKYFNPSDNVDFLRKNKMGDPHNRKNLAVNRLRNQLKKKRESLADQFEFKMYIVFHFKEKVKHLEVFECVT